VPAHELQRAVPIRDAPAAAWMVRALCDGVIGSFSGAVVGADAPMRPEYWRE
jgi:hypothetical protein